MSSPAELLEQALTASGDTLYRVALLAGGEERAAEQLVRALGAELVAAWREAPPAAPPDESFLLARLVAIARRAEEKAAGAKAPPRLSLNPSRPSRANPYAPFPIQRLPFDQRLALGLHLLLGYDAQRLAPVLAVSEEAARAALTDAVRAMGPAAGRTLTDRTSGEHCLAVRAALSDPAAHARNAALVRGHLAICAHCRAFDQGWGEIIQAVETALRQALRERTLPAPLAARLLAAARPARRRLDPTLRLALPPLAVLALIAALVLPGFLRTPVSIVEREQGALADPQELLSKAIVRHSAPPDRNGVWYGRYETQWFFDERTVAPLRAEIWLDSRLPARHRLQLTHADGGAPYELQVGNGRSELYYALDAAYAPALYGSLTTRARPDEPALIVERLDVDGQIRARDERLASGPWGIGPSYLRQAQAAADLRVLGRQRDGDRIVQILSFSGVSPLGLPIDAPGATAERVTVLLALDVEDGLLRSATELAGPAGAEQTSRVTWRLLEEQWLASTEQIARAFTIGQAWTGMGDFSELGRHESADPALPLIAARAVGDPARLLSDGSARLWLPSTPPAGVDRALLLWDERELRGGGPPHGVIYLGEGRRLIMVFNLYRQLEGENLRLGIWRATLQPSRSQRYTLFLARPDDSRETQASGVDPSANVLIDAYGFGRDELLAVARSMRPFDVAGLAAQDELFSRSQSGEPEARAALLQIALQSASTPAGRASYTLARQFLRQAQTFPDPRRDPYHLPPYEGRPTTTRVAEWTVASSAPARYLEVRDDAGDELFAAYGFESGALWRYLPSADALQLVSLGPAPQAARLSSLGNLALTLLASPGAQLSLKRLPEGGALLRADEPAALSRYPIGASGGGSPTEPYIADLAPELISTEIQLGAEGEPQLMRAYVVGALGARTLVESYEILERAELPIAEAPAPLREGEPPAASLALESFTARGGDGSITVSNAMLAARTLPEALAFSATPIYQPGEASGVELTLVEQGYSDPGYRGAVTGELTTYAVAEGLATRTTYHVPPLAEGGPAFSLRITQGPAAPLRAFLRLQPEVPWVISRPAQLTVAGREIEAWVAQGELVYVIAELDDALLILEAHPGWYNLQGPELLAGLGVAPGP
jgi:hypothetical protein